MEPPAKYVYIFFQIITRVFYNYSDLKHLWLVEKQYNWWEKQISKPTYFTLDILISKILSAIHQ